jgi:dTDP-4-amino-4,6-dideoxygalactose transaminase
MSEWRIPLTDLNYGKEEEEAVLRVLRSGWISMGPEVQAFEQEIAEFQRTKHAFAVANGTAGLHLALLALGINQGDEIIQPAINFVAATNMTVAIGATPVFADIISVNEPTIDPTHVEQLITARTKAIIVMHYGGYLCKMQQLLDICRKHKLYLIEDACHAIGAAYDEATMAGSIGDIGTFSFFSNKNLATGEGGMVVTGRHDLAERVRLLRSHGMSTLTWDRHKGYANTYDVSVQGYNYRLDEIHAALGREQLKKLSAGNHRRAELTWLYRKLFSNLPGWNIPFANQNSNSAFHLMPIVAPHATARDKAVQSLRQERIQTSLHYPCITGFSGFSSYKEASVPKSQEFAARVITLPLHPKMDKSAVEQVASALLRVANSPS